eukprot:5081742-Amphidinium_carterae.1
MKQITAKVCTGSSCSQACTGSSFTLARFRPVVLSPLVACGLGVAISSYLGAHCFVGTTGTVSPVAVH